MGRRARQPRQVKVPRIGIRCLDDAPRPPFAPRLVTGERFGLRVSRQRIRQNPGIFQSEIGALRQKRQCRMRRITEDDRTLAPPGLRNGMAEKPPEVRSIHLVEPAPHLWCEIFKRDAERHGIVGQ